MTGFDNPEIEGPALDSSFAAETPEGIEYVLYPAGIPIRACAWGIDCLIKGAVLFVLLVIVSVMEKVLGIWFFLLLNFAVSWFYFTIFELLWNGQTPGKRIMGIRVVGGGGSPVKAGASFLRNLLRFADGFFFLYLFAFVSMAASPGFRRFGDWAADTLVIYTVHSRLPGRFTPPALTRQQALPWLAGIPPVPMAHLDLEEKQGLLMFAWRYPLLGKERADEIARPWAALLRNSQPAGAEEISDSRYLLGIAHTISGIL